MTDDELDRLLEEELGAPESQPHLPDDLAAELWTGIETEIRPPAGRSLAPWLIAAAFVLLNGFGLMSLGPAGSAIRPSLGALPSPGTWAAADEAILPAERDLQAAVVDLQKAYAQRRDDLDPALLAVYDANLEVVGEAVEQSRAALLQHPGDPHLQRMLRHAYDRHLSLLVRATGVGP